MAILIFAIVILLFVFCYTLVRASAIASREEKIFENEIRPKER